MSMTETHITLVLHVTIHIKCDVYVLKTQFVKEALQKEIK